MTSPAASARRNVSMEITLQCPLSSLTIGAVSAKPGQTSISPHAVLKWVQISVSTVFLLQLRTHPLHLHMWASRLTQPLVVYIWHWLIWSSQAFLAITFKSITSLCLWLFQVSYRHSKLVNIIYWLKCILTFRDCYSHWSNIHPWHLQPGSKHFTEIIGCCFLELLPPGVVSSCYEQQCCYKTSSQ